MKTVKTLCFTSLTILTISAAYFFSPSSEHIIKNSSKIHLDGLVVQNCMSDVYIENTSENEKKVTLSLQYSVDENPMSDHCDEPLFGEVFSVEERNHQREEIKQFFTSKASSLITSLSLKGYSEYIISYYTPHVRFFYDDLPSVLNQKEFLLEVEKSEVITSLYIGTEETFSDSAARNTSESAPYDWNTVLIHHGLTNLTKTGVGINVGNLEPSIPDDFTNFDNQYPISKKGTDTTFGKHARTVASIYGGNNGIAPDTNIRFAAVNDFDIVDCVNWLLSSPFSCDIINMSAGWNTTGTYTFISSYFDMISKNAKVVFVVAAGNNGPTYGVASPATGLNAISVASNDVNYQISDFSSSRVDHDFMRAPRITAAGGNLKNIPDIPNNIFTTIKGTSFSTPIVTGIVALLMEEFHLLRFNPNYVQTALLASAIPLISHSYPFDPDGGAGRASYASARIVCQNNNFLPIKRTTGMDGSIAKSVSFSIPMTSRVSISAINIYNSAYTSGNHTSTAPNPIFTKYKLELINNATGQLLAADNGNSNIWAINYTNYISPSATFTIRLVQVGDFSTIGADQITLSSFNTNAFSNLCPHSYTGSSYIPRNHQYHSIECTLCGFNLVELHNFPNPNYIYCLTCEYQL